MSKMSKVVDFALKKKYNKYLSDAEGAKKHMQERSLKEDEPYRIPKRRYLTKVESRDMFGCQMVIFNDIEDCERLVMYLHGGIYVDEIMVQHISFCDKLAKKANACVFAPIYPLAPNHTYEETYDIIENLYTHLLAMDNPVVIMGDSAGGGLAAAFCEYLPSNDLPQPENLILISPWIDISMSGDYDGFESDSVGGVEGLREMGKAWAGELDLKDYKVSPLFGDATQLPKTTLFVGSSELLYPDILKFHEKLVDSGVDVELNIGEGMNHVYPIYPLVPESKEAFNHIVDVIFNQE